MWLFTKHGFFSAVCARQGDGQHNQPIDLDLIMVRARIRQHLETLRERFPDQLSRTEICEFSKADYAFRIFVPKPVWTQVLVKLNEEMDYDNFKSEVARHQGSKGASYANALHDVWEVMNRLQK